jgi:predicted aspartyl protease
VSLSFDPQGAAIVVPTTVWGPSGSVEVRLFLDTGAAGTAVREDALRLLGYDAADAPEQVRVVTATRVERAPRVYVQKLRALGREREHYPVVCHTLPSASGVDGVLGLDFFRGLRLVVDFREGRVTLD